MSTPRCSGGGAARTRTNSTTRVRTLVHLPAHSPAAPVHLANNHTQSSGGSGFREGEKVEARYRGKTRFYPGKIRRENRDGTYDIDYDDGDKEWNVTANRVRLSVHMV